MPEGDQSPRRSGPWAEPLLPFADDRLHVRFPAATFVSRAEFEEYTREIQARLDARYVYERILARAEDSMACAGTCAPCLRRARFTSRTRGGEILPDGRRMPNWREELVCDCEDRLNNRNRALLHFLESTVGLRSWTRVLMFGPACAVDRRIAATAGELRRAGRLGFKPGQDAVGTHRLEAADASFHLAVTVDYLHRVPPLEAALAELCRVLVPGGRLVFTVPFRCRSATSLSRTDRLPRVAGRLPPESAGDSHEIGWDILDRLRAAGFADARAHSYWSEELGYLGSFNMIFSATA